MPADALDCAIIYAPVGSLVPTALKAVRKGGRVVCAGIHMSDIPSFPYRLLWEERILRSVANLTRKDARDFLAVAPRAGVSAHTARYPLEAANEALAKEFGVDPETIVSFNKLDDPTLRIGQLIVIPGGRGIALKPDPTRAPTKLGSSAPRRTYRFAGGRLKWPVPGGYLWEGVAACELPTLVSGGLLSDGGGSVGLLDGEGVVSAGEVDADAV